MKGTFMAIVLLTSLSSFAQKTPAAVTSAFAKNFPGVTVKKWDKEGGKYEANFTKEGKTMSATFDAQGSLEETETDIKISELPSMVPSYIKTNYKGAAIKEAAMIVRGNDTMYEAEVKGKDLLFDMQGKFIKGGSRLIAGNQQKE